jgi:hypothetical protein
MRAYKLFLSSAVLVVLGLASLWSKWDGSAGINAGYPIQQWAVSFNGSVHGWPAMIGSLLILAAIVVVLVGVIRAILASPAT